MSGRTARGDRRGPAPLPVRRRGDAVEVVPQHPVGRDGRPGGPATSRRPPRRWGAGGLHGRERAGAPRACRRGTLRCEVGLAGEACPDAAAGGVRLPRSATAATSAAACTSRRWRSSTTRRFEVVSMDAPGKLAFATFSRRIYDGTHLSAPGVTRTSRAIASRSTSRATTRATCSSSTSTASTARGHAHRGSSSSCARARPAGLEDSPKTSRFTYGDPSAAPCPRRPPASPAARRDMRRSLGHVRRTPRPRVAVLAPADAGARRAHPRRGARPARRRGGGQAHRRRGRRAHDGGVSRSAGCSWSSAWWRSSARSGAGSRSCGACSARGSASTSTSPFSRRRRRSTSPSSRTPTSTTS